MSKVDVTVVMPCYNVEEFLEQAINSALQNDRISLEVLAVNDGSTDSTLEILQKAATLDSRIRVIDKQNEGYGASMNRGISESQGTYIAILEPDDYVDAHMYDELFEFAQSFSLPDLPDIVKTPYTRVYMPNTKHERLYKCSYYERVEPGHMPFMLVDEPRLIQHHPSIWSALYLKSFLDEFSIRFKEVPGAGWVDNPFLIETLSQARTIVYKEKCYYNYREDLPSSSSALKPNTLPVERWHDMADVLDRLNVTDEGIWKSLGVVGFRYAGEIIERGGMEDEECRELMASIFKRLGKERILSIPNVEPAFKRTALRLMGEKEIPHINGAAYYKAIFDEFFYTTKVNGIGFSFARISIFIDRLGISRGKAKNR